MDCSWTAHSAHGVLMDCSWTAHGLLMECSWSPQRLHGLHEQSMSSPWALHRWGTVKYSPWGLWLPISCKCSTLQPWGAMVKQQSTYIFSCHQPGCSGQFCAPKPAGFEIVGQAMKEGHWMERKIALWFDAIEPEGMRYCVHAGTELWQNLPCRSVIASTFVLGSLTSLLLLHD